MYLFSRRFLSSLAVLFSVVLLQTQAMQAQQTLGGITGAVVDPSGSEVPDAEVKLFTRVVREASRRQGISLIGLGEPDYPARLRMIDDAPPLLGVRGKASVLTSHMIALVGSSSTARSPSSSSGEFRDSRSRPLRSASTSSPS